MDSPEPGPRSEAARLKLAQRYPDWRVFRKDDLFCAWWPPAPRLETGYLVLRDRTVPGLAARMKKFREVFGETHSRKRAEAAANDLET